MSEHWALTQHQSTAVLWEDGQVNDFYGERFSILLYVLYVHAHINITWNKHKLFSVKGFLSCVGLLQIKCET